MRNGPFRAEVTPSEEALKILDNGIVLFWIQRPEELFLLARSGSHNRNKYHNVLHELQHVYWAWSCLCNAGVSEIVNRRETTEELVIASLFHDHNHSGGALPDSQNIERALNFVAKNFPENPRIGDLIRVTQFDGKGFPFEPETFAQKCMRDADLCAIYSQEGHRLLLGLFEEMARKRLCEFSEEEMRTAISKSENFLWEREMYTEHGKRMKDDHLASALRVFEDYAWGTWERESNLFELTPSQRAAKRAEAHVNFPIDLPFQTDLPK